MRTALIASVVFLGACSSDSNSDDGSAGSTGEASTGAMDATTASASETGSTSTSTSTGTSTNPTDGSGASSGTGGESMCPQPATLACPASPGFMPADLLSANLEAPTLRIVDVRGSNAFESGHVPGAVLLDPAAMRATVDEVPGQVAAEPDVRALLEAAGLTETDDVVVVGANNGTDPARVVWTLAYYGHQGSLWALDGGFEVWTGDVDTGAATPTPSTYQTQVVAELREDEASVLVAIDDPSWTLFDARSPAEYGAGHIPGAVNVDWTTNLAAGGLFLSPDELDVLYGSPNPGQTMVTYCQTGSRAAVDWLALSSLGFPDVRLYDGSWAQWSADPNNPVE